MFSTIKHKLMHTCSGQNQEAADVNRIFLHSRLFLVFSTIKHKLLHTCSWQNHQAAADVNRIFLAQHAVEPIPEVSDAAVDDLSGRVAAVHV